MTATVTHIGAYIDVNSSGASTGGSLNYTLILPAHIRYHHPTDNGKGAWFEFALPMVYRMFGDDDHLSSPCGYEGYPDGISALFKYNHSRPFELSIATYPSVRNQQQFWFRKIRADGTSSGILLRLYMPTGDMGQTNLVGSANFACICFGIIFILWCLFRKN
jgi:hypothetical protein